MNNTEKLFILGNKLIEAKKRFYRAEYDFENQFATTDSFFREGKRTSKHVKTEAEIKSEIIIATKKQRNELKLSKINLAQSEIEYELEKFRLQFG